MPQGGPATATALVAVQLVGGTLEARRLLLRHCNCRTKATVPAIF